MNTYPLFNDTTNDTKNDTKNDTQIVKEPWDLTFQSLIVGSMLGDSHAERYYNTTLKLGNTRLTFQVSQFNESYSRYLYLICNNYTHCTKPTFEERSSNTKTYQSLRFKTKRNPIFNQIHDYFYNGQIKILPQNIQHYLTPLALAIWFMDDGSKCGPGIRFATNKYSIQDVERLCHILNNKFSLIATSNKCGRPHQRVIYISSKSINKFYNIVKPYILPEMLYKIPQKSLKNK